MSKTSLKSVLIRVIRGQFSSNVGITNFYITSS